VIGIRINRKPSTPMVLVLKYLSVSSNIWFRDNPKLVSPRFSVVCIMIFPLLVGEVWMLFSGNNHNIL